MAIETKSVVQGMVQALFGAAAGGHLGSLTSQATSLGTVGLASSMLNAVPITLGVDLSDNEDFIDHILTNLGLEADTDAYDAGLAWAGGQLTAGTARATLVAGAVQYLLELTDETSDYFDLAQAFQESVELAVEWSEGDGADTLGIDDLVAYIDGGQFTLASGLAAKEAAEEVVASAVDAYNAEEELTGDDELDAEGVAAALTTAVDDAVDALESIVSGWDVDNSAKKNAALIASVEDDLEVAVEEAQEAVDEYVYLVDDEETALTAKEIKAIKAVVSAQALQTAADEALNDEEDGAAAAAVAALEAADVIHDAFELTGDDSEGYLVEDEETGEWSLDEDLTDEDALLEELPTDALVATYLEALQTLVDANNAELAATEALAAADALVLKRFEALVAVNPDLATISEDVDGVETGAFEDAAGDYVVLLTELSEEQDALDALPEAIEAYEDAVAAEEAFAELTDAVLAAAADLTANDYELIDLAADDTAVASDLTDLFFTSDLEAGDEASVIGADGGDTIYIGTDFVVGGEDDKVGVLELFMEQDGDDVIVTIETETYAYSTATTADEIVITLVGVDVDDLSFANGVLTVGGAVG